MQGRELTWTQPYVGVQHLEGLPRGWQVTVENRGSFSDAYVLAPGHGFTPMAEQTFNNVQAARVWAEQQARLLAGKEA